MEGDLFLHIKGGLFAYSFSGQTQPCVFGVLLRNGLESGPSSKVEKGHGEGKGAEALRLPLGPLGPDALSQKSLKPLPTLSGGLLAPFAGAEQCQGT